MPDYSSDLNARRINPELHEFDASAFKQHRWEASLRDKKQEQVITGKKDISQ